MISHRSPWVGGNEAARCRSAVFHTEARCAGPGGEWGFEGIVRLAEGKYYWGDILVGCFSPFPDHRQSWTRTAYCNPAAKLLSCIFNALRIA
jgi:hypothetical protein